MKTCKKCFYFQVCANVLKNQLFIREKMLKEENPKCEHYIPAADVVKVVRCKDCGMSRETEDERYLFCMQFADTVACQAFCSYGERRAE